MEVAMNNLVINIILALLIPLVLIGVTRLIRGRSTVDYKSKIFWVAYLAVAAGFFAVLMARG